MKRREFIFRSLKASLLLSPVLSIRRAEAQSLPPLRAFFAVNSCGYPTGADFFPTGSETNFNLPYIIGGYANLKSDIVVIDGINSRASGPAPRGNNHVRSMGKVLTAKDIIQKGREEDGVPGGVSIDQFLVQQLKYKSLEVVVDNRYRDHMRWQPFATGRSVVKHPIQDPSQAFTKIFSGFKPPAQETPAEKQRRIAALIQNRSLLDDLMEDLTRFRAELVGVEKLKLDIHEDAIRKAEQSVAADIKEAQGTSAMAACRVPGNPGRPGNFPTQSQAHFDLLYAAFTCQRIGIGALLMGFSGYHWRYEWVPGIKTDTIHNSVHHRASQEREQYRRAARWDWDQVAKFAERLKATPDGSGTLLDNVLILSTSNFGNHHSQARLPTMLIGNAQGKLRTGRFLKLSGTQDNSKLLTSVARLMNVNANGFGDFPGSGPLGGL
ncbi:MAG: DUF1552 domain-containing protein [Bdellovibrionaceae bacterium]|nr:DUF1552 domain-containing protein [Bdellovibrionales bacterium]MCB9083428.1 DUF1552 domain-containing protein [Pseudobdellovibrionaceae bacterium]